MAVLWRGEAVEERLMLGRTRRFCLEGGNISSRSTGTPSETRNRRRIRLLVQFGGAIGGGWRSCCHNESDRSEGKAVPVMSEGADCAVVDLESGNIMSRYGSIEESISVGVAKFNEGWKILVSPGGNNCR